MLQITIREAMAAIRKNGYRKARGSYIRRKNNGEVWAACALGQGALNLGVHPINFDTALPTAISNKIKDLNDDTSASLSQIADKIEILYPEEMDKVIYIEQK